MCLYVLLGVSLSFWEQVLGRTYTSTHGEASGFFVSWTSFMRRYSNSSRGRHATVCSSRQSSFFSSRKSVRPAGAAYTDSSPTMNTGTTEQFHGLKLLAHCGCGAFGDVWYCQDISERKMAVKIVPKKKLGDSWSRELNGVINYRKITENSPELLQIFHVEEDEEHFFYTMEAADSVSSEEYKPDTLAARLNHGPLPQDEGFGVLSAIFAGIRTIHDAGFAHRDIKPDNILFVKGVPKLGDIGLISSLSTAATSLAGTIEFLPPEVRSAEGGDPATRTTTQKNDL